MATDKVIIWKKWIDPFDIDDELVDDDENPYSEDDEDKPSSAGPVLVSPIGVIPLNEHNIPSRVFRFWMGHTNFDICAQEKDIIESVQGVETLEIFTRYRFRISIGIAFDEEEVKAAIERAVAPISKQESKVGSIDKLKKYLCTNYKFWAIFVLPSGEVDYKVGDSQDSVTEKIKNYPDKATYVLASWEASDGEKKNGNGRGISASFSK